MTTNELTTHQPHCPHCQRPLPSLPVRERPQSSQRHRSLMSIEVTELENGARKTVTTFDWGSEYRDGK
jgi:hypothetical protein